MRSSPVVKEVQVGVKTGGQVQIVKFKLQNTFEFTYQETYDIPETWTDEQIAAFRQERFTALKDLVDAKAQEEQDALLASSDWYTP